MKKIIIAALVLFLSGTAFSQHKIEIKEWLQLGPVKVQMPIFHDNENIDGKTFSRSNQLKAFKPNFELNPSVGSSLTIFGKVLTWSKVEAGADSIIMNKVDSSNFIIYAAYINADRWTKAKPEIMTNAMFEFYVDGKLVKSKTTSDMKSVKADIKLKRGKHIMILKLLGNNDDIKLNCNISFDKDYNENTLSTSLDPKDIISIDDVLNGEKITSASLSPSGTYLLINYREVENGKSKSYSILKNLKTNQNVSVFRNQKVSRVQWLPRSDKLSYVLSFEKTSELYVYDVKSAKETKIASGIKDMSFYQWSPTEDFIIYSQRVKAKNPGDLKRIFGNDDRLPNFRDRAYLNMIDVKSGTVKPITYGTYSTSLHDIHPSGKKALISTSRRDYSEIPFSKQNLYELDLVSFDLKTIWKDKPYGGRALYSPDGNMLLVQGAPLCFGDIGKKVSEGKIPNSYDSQLYLYNLKTNKVEALSLNFDPSVSSAYWSKTGDIYVRVGEKDYNNLYKLNLKNKKFKKIPLQTEVLRQINYAYDQPLAVYSGNGISTPNKLYLLNLSSLKSTLLDYPDKERFTNIQFGKSEDWNFVNKNKTTIVGRIYYPPGFDKTKKYPVIVYYYGGTSPVTRDFGGRYPKEIWAANGYVVYVLQPSGATGFGQEFSALHVNGWGFDAIDDIIDGTKKFLKAHPFADAENVGCIGASYGGYTTMLLQTRTDIFKTAISHAGISSITSYWGEGYWGYSYSAGATTGSYPWNRKDIYVENSPVYNADKFKNSILLLHGTSDTNVPVGESKQFYAALKILGKDVEMVLVDGEDHWILDYEKRKKWHRTIISWFDKKLKDQPQEWEDMFPDKNL